MAPYYCILTRLRELLMSPRLSRRMKKLRLSLGGTRFMIYISVLSVVDLFMLKGK